MASSVEALERFSKWKKSQTSLNFVEITQSGTEKRRSGEIFHVDEGEGTVGFVDNLTRDFFPFSLAGASCFVTDNSVEVLRADLGCLFFEEPLDS